MRKIFILLICITVFYTVSGLKCYRCRGMDCSKGGWDIRDCHAKDLLPGYQNACLKLEYIDAMTQQKKIQRKCVVVEMRNDQPFYICPTEEGYPVDCPVCLTDLCNSSAVVKDTIVIVFSGYILTRISQLF